MARSVKKNLGGKITTARSDKVSKRLWHKSVRAMKRNWIENAKSANDIEEISASPRDVDSPRADTWSWQSDGGSFLKETDESVRKMLENLIQNAEEEVQEYKTGGNRWKSDWKMISVVSRFIKIESAKQVREFLGRKENSEKVLALWKKLNYGK